MPGRLPKKVMQEQREAYDAAARELGLPVGKVVRGKGHWKYVIETAWGTVTALIASSPRCGEFSMQQSKANLRKSLHEVLTHRGAN